MGQKTHQEEEEEDGVDKEDNEEYGEVKASFVFVAVSISGALWRRP